VNVKLYDGWGHVRRRLDLSYPEIRLIVEYDGRQHAEDTAQWNSDLERREEFDDGQWRILVVTAKGIYREPERTLQRVHKALVARGYPGVPRRFSDDWQVHFPARP
jgi:very-short-patch-repair endonuclease